VLVWLSVWGEVQICICPADATATHCLLLQYIQIGFTFLVPAHPGSPGKRADKRMSCQKQHIVYWLTFRPWTCGCLQDCQDWLLVADVSIQHTVPHVGSSPYLSIHFAALSDLFYTGVSNWKSVLKKASNLRTSSGLTEESLGFETETMIIGMFVFGCK